MTLTADTVNPPTLWGDDEPRVRYSDPATSHAAADASQATIRDVRAGVLWLVSIHGNLTGSELNDLYDIATGREQVVRARYDSPRKRSGEAITDGLLEAYTIRDSQRVFRLTDLGRAAVNA